MAESTGPEDSIWAVVETPGGNRYIGCVDKDGMDEDRPYILFNETYSLSTQNIPVPTQQGMAMQRSSDIYPVDNCLHLVRMRLMNPSVVMYMDDLDASDRQTYLAMLNACRAQIQQARLQKAGIATPPQGGPGIVQP